MMLIAPATAHTISNLVTGKADVFFLATFLSCSAPVFVAPAMDLDMSKMNQHKIISTHLLKEEYISLTLMKGN